ncbi:tetratricopeptide repeat protein [Agarivorans sp. DSG3-1]|uniref:tetratricopeptide repeat protein n=1 Tax=Agarivorans sp. DSG3-1 TaxID=3342249 RepID=UPI00398E9826
MDISKKLIERKKYLNFDPTNIRLIAEVIELSIKSGDIKFAWDLSFDTMKNLEADENCLYWTVYSALACSEYQHVVTWLDSYIFGTEPKSWMFHNYCYAAMRLGQYREIIELLESNREVIKESPELLLSKAKSQHFLGSFEESEDTLNSFLSSSPSHPEALGQLGLLYVDLGRNSEAKECAQLALSIDKNQLDSLLVLATVELIDLNFSLANSHVKQVLDKSPRLGRALTLKGQLQLNDNAPEKALISFKQAIKTMPNHIGTWHGLAWSYMLLDQLQDSRQCFFSALELDRNFAESHGGLAVLSAISGDLSGSKEYLARALGIDKQSFSGLFCKAIILRKEGHEKKADDLIEIILNSSLPHYNQSIKSLLNTINDKRAGYIND